MSPTSRGFVRLILSVFLFAAFIAISPNLSAHGGGGWENAWSHFPLWRAACHSVTLVDESYGSDGKITSAVDSKVEFKAEGAKCKDLNEWSLHINPATIDITATRALNPGLKLQRTWFGLNVETNQKAGTLRTVYIKTTEPLEEDAIYFSRAAIFVTAGRLQIGDFGSDVTVNVAVTPQSPRVGELVGFDVTLSNLGPEATVDTQVELSIPANFIVLNVILPDPEIEAVTTAEGIQLNYGSKDVGYVSTARIEGYFAVEGEYTVVTAVTEVNDRQIVNNEAEITFVTQVAQTATIDLSAQPQEVYVADKVKATYTVHNESYVAVTNVQMEFKLSSSDGGEAQYTAVTVSQGNYEIRDNTVYVAVTELKAGETMTVQTETEYVAAGTVQTTATIRSDNTVTAVYTATTTATVRPEAPKVTATYSRVDFPTATTEKVYYTVNTVQSATGQMKTQLYAVAANTVQVAVGTVKQDDKDISGDCVFSKRPDGGVEIDCGKIVLPAGSTEIAIEVTPTLNSERLREDIQVDSDFIVDTGTVSVNSTIGVIAKDVPGGFELVPFEGNPVQVAQFAAAEVTYEGNNYTAAAVQVATVEVYAPKQEVEVNIKQVAYGEVAVACQNPPCDRIVYQGAEFASAEASPLVATVEASHTFQTTQSATLYVEAKDENGRVVASSQYTFEVLPAEPLECPKDTTGAPICDADPTICCQLRECAGASICIR